MTPRPISTHPNRGRSPRPRPTTYGHPSRWPSSSITFVTHRLGGCFALTLLGLRREEVGGLRWSDVELDTGALHIRRARVDVNGRDTIVPTKTERSARGLPVPPRELAMLKAMRSVH